MDSGDDDAEEEKELPCKNHARFAAMFKDVEEDTHLRASELLTHLGWAEDSA